MSRVWWRLLFWLLVLALTAALLVPLTERGSGLLLDKLAAFLPLEIEYGGGRLAGELQLRRLAWTGQSVRLELVDVVLELDPVCLWRSRICFQQLQAGELDIALLPQPALPADAPASPPAGEGALVVFPADMRARNLRLGALRVRWEGGEWRQGELEGSVSLSGSTVHVRRAEVQNALLALQGDAAASAVVVLPQISLPLELVVDDLVLQQPGWDLGARVGQLHSLRLGGHWLRQALQLDRLETRSAELGEWQASGKVDFSGSWPMALDAQATLPALAGWSRLLGPRLGLQASGDLAALALRITGSGEPELALTGELNALEPDLPFQLVLAADWVGTQQLAEWAELPGALADATLQAPLRLAAHGSLTEQVFQLQASGSALGYAGLDIHLAGRHRASVLSLEDLRLQDKDAVNTLWGHGEVSYGERWQWSLALESSGLDVPPSVEHVAGRIKGQLQLGGQAEGASWALQLTEVKLQGEVNGLPARVQGFAGIDDQLRLQHSDLTGDVNGVKLLLQKAAEADAPGRLELSLDELARWLPDSRGRLSLQARMSPDQQQFTVEGAVRGLDWHEVALAEGRLKGSFAPFGGGVFKLDLDTSDVALAGVKFDRLRLLASGDDAAQEASLRAWGDVDGELELSGGPAAQGEWQGQLASTSLQTDQGNWHLEQAVAVSFAPSPAQVRLAAHCWQYQQTRLCPGETLLAGTGKASVAVTGDLLPFAVFLPEYLELTGSLQAQFAASWAPAQPLSLQGEMAASELLVTRHYAGGESGSLRWEKVNAVLENGVNGLSVDAGMYAGASRIVALVLRLPGDRARPLAGTLDIAGLQLAALAPFAPGLSQMRGELQGKLQLAGTVDRPLAEGKLLLSGGEFALQGNPTELQGLDLTLTALGDWAEISGRGLLGGGPLDINGRLLSQPALRLELALSGDRHELLLPPYTQMLVSEKLDIKLGSGLLDLRGNIVVHEGSLEHEQLPEGGVELSDDVVEVDYSGKVIYEPSAFNTSMDVSLLIEDQFQILGDMVNATVGGDLQLLQESGQPLRLFGNLNVMGGELRAYQQRLRIQRGTISFSGTPDNPELDVRAQREISSAKVTVGLQLQGTLNQPQLDVFSDPVMSQGETMSYLVRGRGLDTGAGADGLAMALSLGTGLVNQSALVKELNSIPGISNFAFGAEGTAEDTAATVGGYLGERLYLSYGMGIYEPINVLTARLYLQTRLWLEVVSRLENSVDLYYSFDIE